MKSQCFLRIKNEIIGYSKIFNWHDLDEKARQDTMLLWNLMLLDGVPFVVEHQRIIWSERWSGNENLKYL